MFFRQQSSVPPRRPPASPAGRRSLPASGVLALTAALLGIPALADAGVPTSLDDASLGELLDTPVSDLLKMELKVTTQAPLTLRESPGIVSLITRDEIRRSGARDLIDVLSRVPGLAFGLDIGGAVGLGVRGTWAHEGKALLLIDGQEFNELLYATLQFGHHYPLELVERIEVIRGPGSAVYGGNAELAVINIVTRGAEQNGFAVSGSYGQMAGGYGQRQLSFSYGKQLGGPRDLAVSLAGTVGQGQRSDGTYTDLAGHGAPMTGNSSLDPLFVDAGVTYRDLSLRLILDDYSITSRDGYGDVLPAAVRVGFPGVYSEVRWDYKLSPTLTLMPKLNYRAGIPWRSPQKHFADGSDSPLFQDIGTDRASASLAVDYERPDQLSWLSGVQAYQDRGWLRDDTLIGSQALLEGGRKNISYRNLALFTQATLRHALANVVAGARFEVHSEYGRSFVPRLGITRVFGDFHAKLLWTNAFRVPAIFNLAVGKDLVPERTRVVEVEVGRRFGDWLFVTANAFDIAITDPIVYTYDQATSSELYKNYKSTGTRGAEVEARLSGHAVQVHASYSFYSAAGRNEVELYRVPTAANLLLAMPAHKVVLDATFFASADLAVTPSVMVMSPRYASLGQDAGAAAEPTAVLVDVFASRRNVGVKGLEVGLGVHNLLNQNVRFAQPYTGGHASLPGPTREVLLRVSYEPES